MRVLWTVVIVFSATLAHAQTQGAAGGDTAPSDRPLRLSFIGNSFTSVGSIPPLAKRIAESAGWPAPVVEYSAPGGKDLTYHRTLKATLDGVDKGNWDFVVVQEYSTKPTHIAAEPAHKSVRLPGA